MDEFVWVLPENTNWDIPIGAHILAKFGSRIKIKDDDHNEYWVSPKEILRPMHPTSVLGVEDMISLGELQECSILRNLQIRYTKDFIYTYIGSILVAVNPYKSLPIYGKNNMNEYRKKRLGELPPHIFAVADYSYENMRKMSEKRCIVISGESGAGKTESTKLFLQYFAAISHKLSGKEKQILDSNPVLEAFGNAKTVCNDNSSRFGKYISINFNTDGSIHNAQIKQYLLEKSRIVSQNQGEQNYHIFYSLLQGLSAEEKLRLRLKDVSSYNYLNKTSPKILREETIPVYDVEVIKSAMRVLNFSELEIWCIFEMIATILHFGNIEFSTVSVPNAERVANDTNEEIEIICTLLQVPEQFLVDSLTRKAISTHGDIVVKFLSKQEAINSRDAFVKKIFGNLFNFIVDKINAGLSSDGKTSNWNIGILDIFGFEAFERNSFEQLCINYANEKLQQFFTGHVFKTEQEQYAIEGIDWEFVEYPDNTNILNLIETGPKSILAVINDATKIPKGSDQNMLDKLIEFHRENPSFLKPKYKNTPVFGIKHFAGIVLYDTKDFVEKNHDVCSLDIKKVVQSSKNNFFKKVFSTDFDSSTYYKKRMETLTSKFKSSLDLLMGELSEGQPFFVRCIKPNELKKPQKFDRMLCCKQLKYSGMTEVTKVREAGYPVRYDFVQFVQQYRMLIPGIPLAHKASCKDATQRICETVFKKFQNPDYRLGRTKIFLKHAEEVFLEAERERVLYCYAVVIQKTIRGWLARQRLFKLKKAVILTEKCWEKKQHRFKEFQRFRELVIGLQARCRGYLVRKLVKQTLEKILTNNRIKAPESAKDSADFKEFAQKYFQDKHSHRFCKKPIKSSLTRLVHPEEEIAAKAIWLTILRYTNNISECPSVAAKVSVGSQLREILKVIASINQDPVSKAQRGSERAVGASRIDWLYKEWLKLRTTHIHKLCFILGHGIKRPELRDEIYCQICKVLTKNPSKKARQRGWDLLSSCTGCFPPSDLFLPYLKTFIREGDPKYTSFCLFRLHRTMQNGSRTQPPFSTELEAIKRQKPVNVDVFLPNGATTSVKIDSATTANELLNLVAKNIKLTEVFGFSLGLGQELRRLPLGGGSSFVLDAVSEYEQYVMEVAESFENMHWRLALRREMFAPWHDFIVDEVARELTYHQIKEGVITGEFGFQDQDLPIVLARICYIEGGQLQPSALNEVIAHYVPEHISIDFDQFKLNVRGAYEKMFCEDEKPVDSIKEEVVKYAAENWFIQFSRFFNVVGSIKNLKNAEPYPEVPLVVGVNSSGVFIIDESNEKRVIANMNFMDIREVSRKEVAKGQGYVLKITNYEDMEVSLIIQSELDIDLHKLLIVIIETLKKYSKFVISVRNYDNQDGSFLELKKGDLITLSDKFYGRDLLRNSWAEGYNNRSSQTGNFVLECVEIIPTVQKPSQFLLQAMKNAIMHGRRIPLCQNAERLKHYTLESYADKYFRIDGMEAEKYSELWKCTKEKIRKPLHAKLVNKEKEAQQAVEIFDAILQYSGPNETINEEDFVSKIFNSALENAQLRDETYCQIMKQLTSNLNKENENKTWELMWMLTGLFPCGEILAIHVKKFLQSRRTTQIARECLARFQTTLNSEPRKYPPHTIEIEGVQSRPCHIFHRIYFPDDTHKFFQVTSHTKVGDLQKAIKTRLGINLSKTGFCLFVQILERLFLMPENYYVFDYLQIFRKWMKKNKLAKTKSEYKICFMKHNSKSSVPSNDKIIDFKFVFPQEYNKYIQGHYEIPTEDVIQLAALLYEVFFLNETTQQFQKMLQKLVPPKVVSLMKNENWEKEIQGVLNKQLFTSKEDSKLKFLQQLNKFSSHALPYFMALPTLNLTNYIFYPVTLNSSFRA